MKITLLGSFHGHNAGDFAMLLSTLSLFKEYEPSVEFQVLSARPQLLEGKVEAHIIPSRPIDLSVNLLGLPSFLAIRNSDAVLFTASLFFDRQLFNPAFNYLLPLSLLIPFAKALNKPVIGYNAGIGPLRTKLGKALAKRTLNKVDLLILREREATGLLKKIGVTKPKVILGADPVICLSPIRKQRALEILRGKGLDGGCIGINLTGYLDSWITPPRIRMPRTRFLEVMSESCCQIYERFHKKIALLVFNYRYDERISRELTERIADKVELPILSNRQYSPQELLGVVGEMDAIIGMRLHSIVMAAATCVPAVAIIYSPKVKDFLNQIGQQDMGIEFEQFDASILLSNLEKALAQRERQASVISEKVGELKELVRQSTKTVLDFLKGD